MSRIGKLPIPVPAGVQVTLDGTMLTVKGPKGELNRNFHEKMSVELKDETLVVSRDSDSKESRSLHGLTRALLNNMVVGVTAGYTKKLQIVGVGYKAEMKGKNLLLTVGYSHPIMIAVPDEIKLSTPSPTEIVVEGIDKELVGKIAAKIRSYRKPEPYKGKGIKYEGEYIRRKAGKTAGK